MKKYKFTMHTGNTTTIAIVSDPIFDNGVVKARMVGECNGFNVNGGYAFKKCNPHEFIAGGGGYTLEEYNGEIS